MRHLFVASALAAALLLAPAIAQENRALIDDVRVLRDQLAQVRGVQFRSGGIDVLAAQRVLAEAIIEIDRRLSALEAQRAR